MELEYDSRYAGWLSGAGITPPADPINLKGVVKAILANLEAVGVGELLGRVQYAPSSVHTYSPVVSSTGLTALDTTNLVLTFTVPPSGSVLVKTFGFIKGGAAAASSTVFGVTSQDATHSPGTVVGVTALAALTPTATAADNGAMAAVSQLVTGLTPAASLTWYFAAMYSGTQTSILAQGSTSQTAVPTGAPAVMEVWAA